MGYGSGVHHGFRQATDGSKFFGFVRDLLKYRSRSLLALTDHSIKQGVPHLLPSTCEWHPTRQGDPLTFCAFFYRTDSAMRSVWQDSRTKSVNHEASHALWYSDRSYPGGSSLDLPARSGCGWSALEMGPDNRRHLPSSRRPGWPCCRTQATESLPVVSPSYRAFLPHRCRYDRMDPAATLRAWSIRSCGRDSWLPPGQVQ